MKTAMEWSCEVQGLDDRFDTADRDDLIRLFEGAMQQERAETIEECAKVCRLVYREHRRSKSYPMDMGGLAEECEERIRALAAPPKGTK